MYAKKILDSYAKEVGWTDEQKLAICEEFIDDLIANNRKHKADLQLFLALKADDTFEDEVSDPGEDYDEDHANDDLNYFDVNEIQDDYDYGK